MIKEILQRQSGEVTRNLVILHADFLRVSEDHTIQIACLHFINEEKCVGVKTGGGPDSQVDERNRRYLPAERPAEFIEVDMLEVDLGQSVHLSDISLPEGVTSVALSHGAESDHSVASVQAPRGGAEDEMGSEAAEEAEAEAAGEDEAEEDS